jgi:diaminohydroxyphosphoribosylaminopyrimidine deaminase / 5-amino-6-(5-phosphoribosylamino)uracil reductase
MLQCNMALLFIDRANKNHSTKLQKITVRPLVNEKKMTTDETYMHRCIQLARLGQGRVAPNPMVGCVVVHNDRIIGEGYHRTFGEAHAEVNAIRSVKNKDLLKESSLYVSLEPCSHHGKTPPCADLIVQHGIPRVIIATEDPNPRVSGNGIRLLQDAGVTVVTGILADAAKELNNYFFTYHTKKRPYITLKWAQSADGYIDGNQDKPIQLSNETTKTLVHKLRAENMAILVGTHTAIKDNPSLLTRRWHGNNPVRISIDKDLRIPTDYLLYNKKAPTLLFNAKKQAEGNPCFVKIDFSVDIIPQLLEELYKRKINSLIVEGGRILLEAFITGGYYDEIHEETAVFSLFEGTKSPSFSEATWHSSETVGKNTCATYLKKK